MDISHITWQDFLSLLTLKGKDTGVLMRVKNMQDDVMKFQICYDETKSYLEEWLKTKIKICAKSSSESIEFRVTGNQLYQKGKDKEALQFYNLSISAAPYYTNEFALALSNRSAVLGRLDYLKEAIRDIDLALQHGNNEIPRTKLLIRKAILLHKLCLYSDALRVIKSLCPSEDEIRSHDNIDLKNAYFDAIQKNKFGGSKSKDTSAITTQHLPIPKGGENKHFPSASAHVSLRYSEEKGRHVIADANFDKSSIIFVETPFALIVLPDQYKQHCHHCCKRVVAFIPCKECTRALFCSEQCCKVAWTRYHQWECKGLEICHSIGIAHLGLRVALMADTSNQYQLVYDLVSHLDDINPEDLYQYTITAVLLTQYLEQYTSYFTSQPSLKLEEMGFRILHHIAQLICNGHAITKIGSLSTEKEGSKTATEEQVRIATAIYPSASMMNHSCDQNIDNSFINECLVVTARRPINKGEEVFNCYGPNHKTMTKEVRQQILKSQYFFSCKCPRCSCSSKLQNQQFSALQCQFCYGPVMPNHAGCADCLRGQPLTQIMDMALVAQQAFHKGEQFFKAGDLNNALTFIEESVKLSSKCLYKHNLDLRHYKDFLARTYVELGKYGEAIPIIEDCIESIELQFGNDSSELARELSKLYDLIVLELEKLLAEGKQDSEEYRLKLHKNENVVKKIMKITGDDVLSPVNQVLRKLPASVSSVKISSK